MPKTIRQSVTFKATPHEVYEALLDSRKHAKFGDNIPYGIRMDDLMNFATSQYMARMNAIRRVVSSR